VQRDLVVRFVGAVIAFGVAWTQYARTDADRRDEAGKALIGKTFNYAFQKAAPLLFAVIGVFLLVTALIRL